MSIDSVTGTTEDVSFSLSAWSHDYAFTGQDVRLAFDNFTVNAGQVIFASTTPTPTSTPTPTRTPTGPTPNVTLRVGDATTAPGQQRVAIPVLLTNDVAVRAVQFALSDVPDQVTLSGSPTCSTTARSSGLTCDCNQSGGVIRCVLLSTGAATIAAGSGQVATVFVDDAAPSCTAGQTIQLNLSETAVADANNNPLSHTTANGSLRCGCPEDLNCDGPVNIFDALICVDLILGRNPARCAEADLDGSGRTDIFDCLLIVDSILGRRQSCSAPPITPGAATATATPTRTRTPTPTGPWPTATDTARPGTPGTATRTATIPRTVTATPTATGTCFDVTGCWAGSYTGGASGTWSANIVQSGTTLSGSGTINDAVVGTQSGALSGTIACNQITWGVTPTNATFTGTVTTENSASGTWSGSSGLSGTWGGVRTACPTETPVHPEATATLTPPRPTTTPTTPAAP
jgi:hypothetical protein